MPQDRFMIAPLTSGQQSDVKPWLIADDAYESLRNAYLFRGRVRKRFGSRPMNTSVDSAIAQLYTRLRVNLGDIGDTGAHSLSGNVPGTSYFVGQMFSVGDVMFSVNTAGAANMLNTAAAAIITVKTYNTGTGAYNITFADATYDGVPVYFYPTLPVMGFITYETGVVNDNAVIAFDTRFSYQYIANGWERIGAAVWSGSDSQFFWGTTWQSDNAYESLLFVVNFNQADQIKYWNGATATWTTIHPATIITADYTLETSRILIVFKDRLLALNTIEQEGAGIYRSYVNRVRWSQNGSPVQADAWRTDIPGKDH